MYILIFSMYLLHNMYIHQEFLSIDVALILCTLYIRGYSWWKYLSPQPPHQNRQMVIPKTYFQTVCISCFFFLLFAHNLVQLGLMVFTIFSHHFVVYRQWWGKEKMEEEDEESKQCSSTLTHTHQILLFSSSVWAAQIKQSNYLLFCVHARTCPHSRLLDQYFVSRGEDSSYVLFFIYFYFSFFNPVSSTFFRFSLPLKSCFLYTSLHPFLFVLYFLFIFALQFLKTLLLTFLRFFFFLFLFLKTFLFFLWHSFFLVSSFFHFAVSFFFFFQFLLIFFFSIFIFLFFDFLLFFFQSLSSLLGFFFFNLLYYLSFPFQSFFFFLFFCFLSVFIFTSLSLLPYFSFFLSILIFISLSF